jgi:hypothetical protein
MTISGGRKVRPHFARRIPARKRPKFWRDWWNIGLHVRRCLHRPPVGWHDRETYINRERVFAEEWEKDNPKRYEGVSRTLECLFAVPTPEGHRGAWLSSLSGDGLYMRKAFGWRAPSYRDRVVAATVVQWLGTNVGFAFLETCLRKCGYTVRRIEPAARRVPRPAGGS